MSKGMQGSTSTKWFKATPRRQEVLMASDIHSTVTHWDPVVRRSRRCSGRDCYACAVGVPKVLRFVVLVIDERGVDWLLELRERHRERLNACISSGGKICGWRVVIKKEGQAINSAVSCEPLAREFAAERDITRLVDSLYLPAISIGQPSNVEDETSRMR